jgi:hypothetical protein
MKKYVFIIVLFLVSLSGYAQKSVDELFDSCKDMNNASIVDIPKSLINSSVLKTLKDKKYKKIWKNIDSVRIIYVEESTPEIKAKMMNIVADCEKEGMERIVQSNDDDGKSFIMAKPVGDRVKNLLVIFIDEDESVLVKIDGNISMSDLSKVTKVMLPK